MKPLKTASERIRALREKQLERERELAPATCGCLRCKIHGGRAA